MQNADIKITILQKIREKYHNNYLLYNHTFRCADFCFFSFSLFIVGRMPHHIIHFPSSFSAFFILSSLVLRSARCYRYEQQLGNIGCGIIFCNYRLSDSKDELQQHKMHFDFEIKVGFLQNLLCCIKFSKILVFSFKCSHH